MWYYTGYMIGTGLVLAAVLASYLEEKIRNRRKR